MRILVLFGGNSSEHFVSNRSAYEIIKVLRKMGHQIATLGITRAGDFLPVFEKDELLLSPTWEAEALEALKTLHFSFDSLKKAPFSLKSYVKALVQASGLEDVDVVFPIVHGNTGEDGVLQGFLEVLGFAYIGCRLGASYLGMDKIMAKRLWQQEGIPVVPWEQCQRKVYRQYTEAEKKALHAHLQQTLAEEYFVKPLQGGSSLGANRVRNYEEFLFAMEDCFKYGEVALIEPYLDCRELEIGILGRGDDLQVSAVVEIVKEADTFYDYEAKYGKESTAEVVFEADISQEQKAQIEAWGLKAFQTLGCSQLSRVDFFLDKKTGKLYLNEINTLPGFTLTSGYARAFAKVGVSYESLLERFISYALQEQAEKQ